MKNRIRLTESQLHRVIKESVNNIFNNNQSIEYANYMLDKGLINQDLHHYICSAIKNHCDDITLSEFLSRVASEMFFA